MKIKLTESKLKKIITETVKKVLTENYDSVIGESHVYDDNYPMEVLNSIEGDVEDVLYSLKNCESKTRIYSEGGTIKKYDENLYNLLLQIHEQCVQNIEFFENVSKIINKL